MATCAQCDRQSDGMLCERCFTQYLADDLLQEMTRRFAQLQRWIQDEVWPPEERVQEDSCQHMRCFCQAAVDAPPCACPADEPRPAR